MTIMQSSLAKLKDNYEKVEKELIHTWQPLAAIAYRTDLPIRTCEAILVDMYNKGLVKCSRVRIDGHNKVHLFKKVQVMKIMGMHMVVDTQICEGGEILSKIKEIKNGDGKLKKIKQKWQENADANS